MTTHLVIADDDTLDAMAVESAEKSHVHHVNHREAYTDNGDTWLFRTPESTVPAVDDVGFIFGLDFGVANSLPLIAACDLLGIEELIIYEAEPQDGVMR